MAPKMRADETLDMAREKLVALSRAICRQERFSSRRDCRPNEALHAGTQDTLQASGTTDSAASVGAPEMCSAVR